jgi:Lanthionine synthetase C-like protein
VADAETYRDLAEAAWSWTLDQVCDDDGPWLPESVDEGTSQTATWERDCLYVGIAGTSLALAEVAQHRPFTEREQRLADDVVARLVRQSHTSEYPSLYGGLGGIVTGLRHLAPGAERDALRRIGELRTPAGWVSQEPGPHRDMVLTDIIGGGAGIVLAVLWAGGALDVASAGCDALLADADETEAGLDWGMVPHAPSQGPNFSHGTAGVASALAVAGTALGRADLIAAAARGAEHLCPSGGWTSTALSCRTAFRLPSRGGARHVQLVSRTSGDLAAVRRPLSVRCRRGRWPLHGLAAAALLRCDPRRGSAAAAAAGLLGQRRPVLRHRRRRRRPARRLPGHH